MDGSNASSIPRQRQAQPNMIYSTDLEAEQGVGYGVDPRGKMPQAANVPHNNGAQPWMFVPTSWSADAVGPPPSRSVGPPTQHVPGGVGPGSIGWGVAPNHALRGLVAESSHDASSHASSLEDIGNDFDPEKTIQFDARLPKRLHQVLRQLQPRALSCRIRFPPSVSHLPVSIHCVSFRSLSQRKDGHASAWLLHLCACSS